MIRSQYRAMVVTMLITGVAAHIPDASLLHAQSDRATAAKGCWQTSRPLGPTGSATPVARDSAYNTLVLRDSGRVALPLVTANSRQKWEDRSFWESQGDSVSVRLFTGLQGWSVTLGRSPAGHALTGIARYLTDAISVGAEPLRVNVTLTSITCDPAWPTVATTRSPLRAAPRGAVFFAQQVDHPVAMDSRVPLPPGITAARTLRDNETAEFVAGSERPDVGRVVLQFVVNADGRPDTLTTKVLSSDGDVFSAHAQNALRTMRFRAAQREGRAVAQLHVHYFEVTR